MVIHYIFLLDTFENNMSLRFSVLYFLFDADRFVIEYMEPILKEHTIGNSLAIDQYSIAVFWVSTLLSTFSEHIQFQTNGTFIGPRWKPIFGLLVLASTMSCGYGFMVYAAYTIGWLVIIFGFLSHPKNIAAIWNIQAHEKELTGTKQENKWTAERIIESSHVSGTQNKNEENEKKKKNELTTIDPSPSGDSLLSSAHLRCFPVSRHFSANHSRYFTHLLRISPLVGWMCAYLDHQGIQVNCHTHLSRIFQI